MYFDKITFITFFFFIIPNINNPVLEEFLVMYWSQMILGRKEPKK